MILSSLAKLGCFLIAYFLDLTFLYKVDSFVRVRISHKPSQ